MHHTADSAQQPPSRVNNIGVRLHTLLYKRPARLVHLSHSWQLGTERSQRKQWRSVLWVPGSRPSPPRAPPCQHTACLQQAWTRCRAGATQLTLRIIIIIVRTRVHACTHCAEAPPTGSMLQLRRRHGMAGQSKAAAMRDVRVGLHGSEHQKATRAFRACKKWAHAVQCDSPAHAHTCVQGLG